MTQPRRRRDDLIDNPHFDKLYDKLKNKSNKKQSQTQPHPGDYNLFDNPMVRSARQNMSKEDQDNYKRIGEQMYNGIDFVSTNGNRETMPQPMAEAIAFIVDSIRSGQHISYLEDNEKQLMKETYGDEWYKQYGYVEGDLQDIITFPK